MKETPNYTKTHTAMRSIYRFSEFKLMNAPEVLIDTERNILRRHFAELTAEEIIHIMENFPSFQKEQAMQAALEKEKISENFDHFDRYQAKAN